MLIGRASEWPLQMLHQIDLSCRWLGTLPTCTQKFSRLLPPLRNHHTPAARFRLGHLPPNLYGHCPTEPLSFRTSSPLNHEHTLGQGGMERALSTRSRCSCLTPRHMRHTRTTPRCVSIHGMDQNTLCCMRMWSYGLFATLENLRHFFFVHMISMKNYRYFSKYL